MVDEVRGKIRVRAWPEPRSGPRHPTNEYWSRWLKAATYVFRYSPAVMQWQLINQTKGTVWMPRDVLISAIRGRAWLMQDELGRTWYPLAVVEDVSNSLDAIGQTPGDMLWRGPSLWVPIPKGLPGQVLTYQDDVTPPSWEDAGASGYNVLFLRPRTGSNETINVNSTSYMSPPNLVFPFDGSTFNATQFRITLEGGSGTSGQTVSLQLALDGSPGTPLSAAGDDLTVPFGLGQRDSGWIDLATPLSAYDLFLVALKGSNSTVDLIQRGLEIHFR